MPLLSVHRKTLSVRRKMLLIAMLGAFAFPSVYTQPLLTLPSVTSYSLDKAKVTLPNDLAGQQNILILYFRPDQSDTAVAWANGLQPVKSARPGVQSYLLPIYWKENLLYRWWIAGSLRSAAPPGQDWHSTIPLFVDKNKFLPAIGINNEKQSVVLLTDKQGHIEWRTQGSLDPGKLTALNAALAANAGSGIHAGK